MRSNWQDANLSSNTKALLARDSAAYVHQALSTPCLNALQRCSGSYIEDVEGRRYLDFHGNSVHQVGYGHPLVIEAIKRQLDDLPFCPRRYTNLPATELAEQLGQLTGGQLPRVLLAPSGAVAIGTAMKIARTATGRYKFLSMWGSFHGATLDAISLGGEAIFRQGVGPLLPGVSHVAPPRPERCLLGCAGRCGQIDVAGTGPMLCADMLEHVLRAEGDIAAVVAEPVRCTTVSIPPDGYWKRVRAVCDRHGVLLIFDEIPSCLGRTGRMFAYEHFGVAPDILVIGKGLGGGVFPLAATLVREGLVDGSTSALGHYTHEKSPVGAAAALATIRVIRDGQLLDRAESLGKMFASELRRLATRHELIGPVRQLGLLIGVDVMAIENPSLDATVLAERILYASLSRGLSFKVSDGNVLTLSPPLTLSDQEALEAIRILDEAFEEASR
ncbi:MAG: aspartate aminotransferase family protein [Pyrinomonadaceae bacterium]|nr:aspartate aminotransferase family protein [Phycisphaerales bacterium]